MPFIDVGKGINLYYEDYGAGDPVVLLHGWPSSSAQWEKVVPVLLEAGHRVIAYDRRGFGRSDRPGVGYNYDTLTEDLAAVLERLDLHAATLVGFSMGGGEVAHYLAQHGDRRVRRVVFIGSLTPHFEATPDDPGGLPRGVFDGWRQALRDDRPAFLTVFIKNLYNIDEPRSASTGISDDAARAHWNIAVQSSAIATIQCVSAFGTDLRPDLVKLRMPTLLLHGDADRIVPLANSSARVPGLVPESKLVVIEGGPHGLLWTHADRLNKELLAFLGHTSRA